MCIEFKNILPESLVFEESEVRDFSTVTDLEKILSKQELEIIKGSQKKRRNEFITARICCKRGLKHFNINSFPILRNNNGLPLFPASITGSISHTISLAAVLLGSSDIFKSIGLDIEETGRINEKHLHVFCTGNDTEFLKSFTGKTKLQYATLIFSAKEAFYKMVFGMSGIQINFKDIDIVPEERNRYIVSLHNQSYCRLLNQSKFDGTFLLFRNRVYTAMYMLN